MAQLKEFCKFVEVEECNLLRHVVTKWLSLLRSIDRILKYWKPLTSSFQSLGEDKCSKILWKLDVFSIPQSHSKGVHKLH